MYPAGSESMLTRTLSIEKEIRDLNERGKKFEQRAASATRIVPPLPPQQQQEKEKEQQLETTTTTTSPSPSSNSPTGSSSVLSTPQASPLEHNGMLRHSSVPGYGSYLTELSALEESEVMTKEKKQKLKEKEKLRVMVTDLLYSAARGRLASVKKKVSSLEFMGMLISDPYCCDYDKRTPLHLAAVEGSFQVTEWLLADKHANPNAIDRFGFTPLQGAIAGDHKMIVNLLIEHGGMIMDKGNLVEYKMVNSFGSFADLTHLASGGDSQLAGGATMMSPTKMGGSLCLEDEFWEISSNAVTKDVKLGSGEFGTVYKALWGKTPVAMKVLKQSDNLALGEFVTEMNMMRKLHHPHIVQFLGGCTKSKPYFIVTELSSGGALLDYFHLKFRLPLSREIELAIDCARGMAYLHSSAIRKPSTLHRDLKPANLMIFGNTYAHGDKKRSFNLLHTGTLKVTDFGLSKTLSDIGPRSKDYRLTGETGSYRYMAPEVYRHEDYNHKVDVYAYGMILYQLLEGTPPFTLLEAKQAAVAACLKDKRPKFVSLAKPKFAQLRNLIVRCWAAKPDDRPEFEDLIPELIEIQAQVKEMEEKNQKKTKWYNKFL